MTGEGAAVNQGSSAPLAGYLRCSATKVPRSWMVTISPELDAAEGCHGAYVLRREHHDEVEFVVLHFFDSIDAVRKFAGDNYEAAVVPEPARKLLARFDATAQHYDVRAEPTPASS